MGAKRKETNMIPSPSNAEFVNELLGKLRKVKKRGKTSIEIETDAELREALLVFASKYASGYPLHIVEETKEYTPSEAAEILRVSRPFFNKLLEQGAIQYRMVGTHRRISANDLFRYKEEEEKRSREAFKKHSKFGQRLASDE